MASMAALPFRRIARSNLELGHTEANHRSATQSASKQAAEGPHEPKEEDGHDEDRASIVSLDSDSTNGPFFWYRVVTKFAPKPRNCHTATMVGDKMLVFGGFGGSKWFSELWSFDTSNIEWHQPELQHSARGSSIPPARYAHSAVSHRGLLYIFGGFGGADSWLGDLWVLDTQRIRVRDQTKARMAWERPSTTGQSPSARAAHSADIVGNKLYIFGGNNGLHRMNDLFSLDTQPMHWRQECCSGLVPAPRAGHATVMLPAESSSEDSNPKLLLFGGGDVTEVFNDVLVLDMETLVWSEQPTSGPRPTPRAGHGMTTLPDGNLLVWGGGSVGKVMNDFHILNTSLMVWSGSIDLKMSPEPRVGHSVCMWGSEMYVLGGGDSQTVFGDLTILDSEAVLNHTSSRNFHHGNECSPQGLPVSAPAFSPVQAAVASNYSDVHTQTTWEDLGVGSGDCPYCRGTRGHGTLISNQEAECSEVDDLLQDRSSETSESKPESITQSLTPTSQTSRKVHEMNARHQQLALKLSNRPSKEDLVQQNILKGNDSVTPNIHAAQERIRRRQTGGILEKKLLARPLMSQLVLDKIIPEDDEYEEHEQRLWGHIHNPLKPKNFKSRINQDQTASEGLSNLEDIVMKRLDNLRQGIDSLRLARTRVSRVDQHSEGIEDQERLEHYARTEISTLEHHVMQQIHILRGKVIEGGSEDASSIIPTSAKPVESAETLRIEIPTPPPIPHHLFRGAGKIPSVPNVSKRTKGQPPATAVYPMVVDQNNGSIGETKEATEDLRGEREVVEPSSSGSLHADGVGLERDEYRSENGDKNNTLGNGDSEQWKPDLRGERRSSRGSLDYADDSSEEIDPEKQSTEAERETNSKTKRAEEYHTILQHQDRQGVELQLLQQQEYLQRLLVVNSQALHKVQALAPDQLPWGSAVGDEDFDEVPLFSPRRRSLTASVQKYEVSLILVEEGEPLQRRVVDVEEYNGEQDMLLGNPESESTAGEKDKKRPRRAGRRVKRTTGKHRTILDHRARNHQDAGLSPSLMHGAFVSELDFEGIDGAGQGRRIAGSGRTTPEGGLGSDLELEQCATGVASYLSL